MKMRFLKLNILFFGILLVSCEKNIPTYELPYNMLSFVYANEKDSIINYSFVFEDETIKEKTIWIDVETVGYITDYDRDISIEQVKTDNLDAVEGIHYAPFNDLKEKYIIPAGKNNASIPIVVYRDKTLKENFYNIKLRITSNSDFHTGYNDEHNFKTIIISDKLSKPSNWGDWVYYEYYDLWDGTGLYNYFGEYGVAKHQFMNEITGENVNEEYIQKILDMNDTGYFTYLGEWFQYKLDEYNSERGFLLEEEDGTIVKFGL